MFWITFFASYLVALYVGWLITKQSVRSEIETSYYRLRGQFPWFHFFMGVFATVIGGLVAAVVLAAIWPVTLVGLVVGGVYWKYRTPVDEKLSAARKWIEGKLIA